MSNINPVKIQCSDCIVIVLKIQVFIIKSCLILINWN